MLVDAGKQALGRKGYPDLTVKPLKDPSPFHNRKVPKTVEVHERIPYQLRPGVYIPGNFLGISVQLFSFVGKKLY
jgi:hypothetical protein